MLAVLLVVCWSIFWHEGLQPRSVLHLWWLGRAGVWIKEAELMLWQVVSVADSVHSDLKKQPVVTGQDGGAVVLEKSGAMVTAEAAGKWKWLGIESLACVCVYFCLSALFGIDLLMQHFWSFWSGVGGSSQVVSAHCWEGGFRRLLLPGINQGIYLMYDG